MFLQVGEKLQSLLLAVAARRDGSTMACVRWHGLLLLLGLSDNLWTLLGLLGRRITLHYVSILLVRRLLDVTWSSRGNKNGHW